MSVLRNEDQKKWVNAFVVLVGVFVGFLSIRLIEQLSDWFELEAKVSNFLYLSQGVGVIIGLLTYIIIIKNKKYYLHLKEVYDELVKVIWPNKDTMLKVTVGIVIGVSLISGLFVFVDYVFRKLLDLVY